MSAPLFFVLVAAHPLDPLTREEIVAAVDVVRAAGKLVEGALIPEVSLVEPPKREVLAFTATTPDFRREAHVLVLDRAQNRTSEARVDLRARTLLAFTEAAGVQPSITLEELNLVPELVRADPAWRAAIRKRGIERFEDVMVDPWAPGTLAEDEARDVRWVRALAYLKGKNNNGYARPIEGIVALVNLKERRVERVMDTGVLPVPPESADLDMRAIGAQRKAPKPLEIVQPKGPSFTVRGNEVEWQKWRFRFSVHPREGLVLHTVRYDGRSVLYRANLSEMVVPYGDPAASWIFRNAFDEGEYGIGRLTDTLEVGTDAPKHARFFDAVFADDLGKPFVTPRAVALYERDGGLLWKHFEFYSNKSDSRRGRELVLLTIVTVGNYDYGFQWIFRQDASLEMESLATGIMLPKGVVATSAEVHDPHAHLVAPNVSAPHHQHFFNFRLDLDVDGPEPNEAGELEVTPMTGGADDPARTGFTMHERVLETEKAAQRDLSLERARKWRVSNPSRTTRLGYHPGYVLVPGESSIPFAKPESQVRKRAGFVDHHLWVTPLDEAERHAAGTYPNQSLGGEGLPRWTARDRSIRGKDIVLWYTFGLTHVPRPEEWPVMPVTRIGFKLLPSGFFDQNPALDVPR